ncbi:phosphoribosyltransferase domain-containing protein [Halomonas sp. LS-001]
MTEYQLDTGTLTLAVDDHGRDSRGEKLFRIAERQNPKRAFLFVSTVLGRHIPVATARHRAALDQLAEKLLESLGSGPVLVMSYAETAVGLGLGVFDGLCRKRPGLAAGYLPTTRLCPEGARPWLNTREEHSHAVDHMVLRPREGVLPDAGEVTLVLVDDETTTGNTFKGLAEALHQAGLAVSHIVLVTLTDWSDKGCVTAVEEALPGVSVSAVALLSGRYAWSSTSGVQARKLPPGCPAGCPPWAPDPRATFGVPRAGLSAHAMATDKLAWADYIDRELCPLLTPRSRVLVIGTGEHVWHPFLAAEQLERHGHAASFISTTRSPVLPGAVIQHQITFPDHYGIGITMYLNNVDPEEWDEMIVFTETGLSGIPEALKAALGRCWVVDGVQQIHLINEGDIS